MPKQKTHKGAAKRFAVTKNGLVKHQKAFKGHILTKKSTKRKAPAPSDRLHHHDGGHHQEAYPLQVRKPVVVNQRRQTPNGQN